MLTVDELEKMTIKSLESFLNDCVKDLKYKDTDRRNVRMMMFEEIKQKSHKDVKIYNNNYYSSFHLPTKRYGLEVKISTKATRKTKQVSRLKKKDVCVPGKFKIDSIRGSYTIPRFELNDIKNYSVIINKTSSMSSKSVQITKSDLTFEQMSTPDYFLLQIMEEFERAAEFNERRYNKEKVYKNLKEEIILQAAQPLIKEFFFINNPKEIANRLPEKYTEEIISTEGAWFNICLDIIAEYNSDLIDKVYNDILEDTQHEMDQIL